VGTVVDGSGSRLTPPSTAPSPVLVDSVRCRGGMGRATGVELWAGGFVVIGAAMMDWGAAAADMDGLHDEVKRFALRAKPQAET